MIALVPLARFKVQYEVASGRPYSTLEQLTLRAIASGASTVEGLHSLFQVHPRLVVEAVVTLTKAGWVAVGGPGGKGFVLTATGQAAVSAHEIPPSLAITAKTAYVLVELVTGLLIPNNDVRFVSRRELGDLWDRSVRLPPGVPDNDLDEGQVQPFLARKKAEWIRWIGPIDLVTRGTHWLPVDVDLDAGSMVGLPDALDARLRPYIIESCERMRHRVDSKRLQASLPSSRRVVLRPSTDGEAPRIPEPMVDIRIERADLLLSDAEHETYLARAFEHARTNILVASAFVGSNRIDALTGQIEKALARGVNVDLLWGYAVPDDGAGSLARLKKFAYDAQQKGAKGRLRFNATPSSSHAKLLIWDGEDGYEACVGSFNWLSAQLSAPSSGAIAPGNVSARIQAPALIGRLARCAAALWHGAQSEALASTGDRWRRVASDLESDVACGEMDEALAGANARARLILDREHESALREVIIAARDRMVIVSHRLGPAAEARLVTGGFQRAAGFRGVVLYGSEEVEAAIVANVRDRVQNLGATLELVPGLHAKVVVGDSTAVISSYNFLSADPFGKAARSRELGVIIEGTAPAQWIAERFGVS